MADARHLLDANVLIYLLEGRSEALRGRLEREPAGSVFTSAVACAEVLIGAARTGAGALAAAELLFRAIEPLPFDAADAAVYAGLPFKRGSFDRLIAAQAVARGLVLVTSNERDFADIAGLRVENWST